MAGYSDFERRGFRIKALFDRDKNKVGKEINGIKVYPMEELRQFIKDNNIEIVTLTIPKTAAIEVAKSIADTGIKGIWNFAHTDLALPDSIAVEKRSSPRSKRSCGFIPRPPSHKATVYAFIIQTHKSPVNRQQVA